MTDDEIRAVVRQVLAARGLAPPPGAAPAPAGPHPSHVRLQMVVATEPGSPCLIEPAVACNRCGYCLSMGH
jgi:hypothetical protein